MTVDPRAGQPPTRKGQGGGGEGADKEQQFLPRLGSRADHAVHSSGG